MEWRSRRLARYCGRWLLYWPWHHLPGGQRGELTNLLWGERDTEQARASLRQALAELRRILGSSSLSTDRETAVFEPLVVSIDVVEFTKLSKAEELEEAAALYRGELLEGVSLPGGAFADWLLVERTRYNDIAANLLSRLLASQSGKAAISTALRLLQVELLPRGNTPGADATLF